MQRLWSRNYFSWLQLCDMFSLGLATPYTSGNDAVIQRNWIVPFFIADIDYFNTSGRTALSSFTRLSGYG